LKIIFLPQAEKFRLSVAFHREELQSFRFRLVEKEGSTVERNDASNSFIARRKERFLREVVDDGIVDLEKAVFSLLALSQCLFRLLSLSDVEEGYDGADGLATTKHRMGPILHRETGAIPSPKNVIVDMNSSVFMKTYINGTLVNGKGSSVLARMVLKLVHIFAKQFGGFVVTEQANCCSIAEETCAFRIAAKDSFSGRIENETDSLLTFLQSFFCLFPISDVLRERHDKSRHALGARNQRDVVTYPDETAILTSVRLLDLKLFSFPFQQFRNQSPVSFAIILMSNLEK
jgi:hypothetical protein